MQMTDREWNVRGLENAIQVAGGQEKLGAGIDVGQSLISFWMNRSEKGVSADKCPMIEALYGVPCWALRRDIWPVPAAIADALFAGEPA